jgi:hypothetical protein
LFSHRIISAQKYGGKTANITYTRWRHCPKVTKNGVTYLLWAPKGGFYQAKADYIEPLDM